MTAGVGQPAPLTPESWDAYVRAHPLATYLQTSTWARVKAATGWSSVHVGKRSGPGGPFGAQILTRPIPLLPWRFAYAPRGPLADRWEAETHDAWIAELRRATGRRGPLAGTALLRMDPEVEAAPAVEAGLLAGGGEAEPADAWLAELRRAAGRRGPLAGTALLRMDPEIEAAPAVEAGLLGAGWRRAHDMQPRKTRIVDLAPDEAALWSELRKKWRQYVNKARSNGIVVRDVDPASETDAFERFYEVMREVSQRTALPLRSAATFRGVWEAFAPTRESRLLFAEDGAGALQAVLLTVRCGTRVVEPYGGMSAAGAESRANYLLKWEAIRTSKEQGATSYDMWGLIGTGIDHFKAGFGGREVAYIGAWDLALSPVGALAFRTAERGRQLYRAGRRRMRGEDLALPPGPGADA